MNSLILEEGKISIYLEFLKGHMLLSPNSTDGENKCGEGTELINIFAKYR